MKEQAGGVRGRPRRAFHAQIGGLDHRPSAVVCHRFRHLCVPDVSLDGVGRPLFDYECLAEVGPTEVAAR